jgi:hypothetical protein
MSTFGFMIPDPPEQASNHYGDPLAPQLHRKRSPFESNRESPPSRPFSIPLSRPVAPKSIIRPRKEPGPIKRELKEGLNLRKALEEHELAAQRQNAAAQQQQQTPEALPQPAAADEARSYLTARRPVSTTAYHGYQNAQRQQQQQKQSLLEQYLADQDYISSHGPAPGSRQPSEARLPHSSLGANDQSLYDETPKFASGQGGSPFSPTLPTPQDMGLVYWQNNSTILAHNSPESTNIPWTTESQSHGVFSVASSYSKFRPERSQSSTGSMRQRIVMSRTGSDNHTREVRMPVQLYVDKKRKPPSKFWAVSHVPSIPTLSRSSRRISYTVSEDHTRFPTRHRLRALEGGERRTTVRESQI